MKDHVLVSVRLLVVFTLLLGLRYPAAVWAVGRVAFRDAANGSFVARDGAGRRLLAHRPGRHLARGSSGHARPQPAAATTPPLPAGSNLGPTSKALAERVDGGGCEGAGREPRREGPGPGRRRHRVGLGPRPARLARLRALADPARREGERHPRRRPPGDGRAPHRGPLPRALRRAARERPPAEPGRSRQARNRSGRRPPDADNRARAESPGRPTPRPRGLPPEGSSGRPAPES